LVAGVKIPLMACKKATALFFAVAGTFALHMKSLHTHLETPTLPGTMEYLGLLSFAQNACDDAGIAAAMEYGYDDEGPFIGRVCDQKVPHGMKTQWPRSQIGTDVANLREGDEGANRFVDFLKNPVCGAQIVRRDELPNVIEVCKGLWVKDKTAHEWRRSLLLRRSRLKASSPSMGSTLPLVISS